MTPKLIISSLVGITAIGGVVTGDYYAFNSGNTKELKNKVTNQTTKDKSKAKTTSTESASTQTTVTNTLTTTTETVTTSPSNSVNSDTRGNVATPSQSETAGPNNQLPSR